jgi:hypothetical protein
VPDQLPVFVGENVTLSGICTPAASVMGYVIPFVWNPAARIVWPERMSALLPEFVNVMLMVCVFPTTTFPKFTTLGDTDNCPAA